MPYRILEYEVAIIKCAVNLNKIKNKVYKLPLVIPIVLYTGNKRWNASEYLQQSQETLENIKQDVGRYNLIDINNLTEKELLEDSTFITKMLLIEKCESTEEIIKVLEKIINKVKDKDKDILIRILKLILNEKIGEQEVQRLVSKIQGGDGEMLAVIDMVRRENQMYINMGKKQTCIEIAKKLLSRNIPKEDIQEITGLKQKELDSIAKEK